MESNVSLQANFVGILKQYSVSAAGLGNPPREFRVNENDLDAFLRVLLQNDVAEISIKDRSHTHDITLTQDAHKPLWTAGVHASPNQCGSDHNFTGHGSDGVGQ